MGAQIHFQEKGAIVSGPNGSPLQLLTVRLEDKHELFEQPLKDQTEALQDWLQKYPMAWAETGGMGLAIRQLQLLSI